MRLNKVLLSSYALGESHPDSRWVAFEVWAHPEITVLKCHSEESPVGGTTKNLVVTGSAEILRFAQNDMEGFSDGN